MSRLNPLMLCILFVILSPQAFAQEADSSRSGLIRRYLDYILKPDADPSEPQLMIYPTVGFAPETSWEFGFSTLYVYYAKRDIKNRLSEISAFTFFTLENQYGIWLDHALYSDRDKWFFLGRARFQSFPLLYYGIGPGSPVEPLAQVDANYLLLRERVLRKLRRNLFLGLEVDFQKLSRVDFVPQENEENLTLPTGANGSANLGLGLGLVYDNRHNVLNVRDGFFSELAFLRYDPAWGSEFAFSSLISDTRYYWSMPNQRDVIATQLFAQFTGAGETPFNQLALMGGESLMRGYYLGRFRDDHLLASQIEYRLLPFSFSERWGAAAFLAAGQVFSNQNPLAINRTLLTAGAGLRFLLFPQKDIYTRLDFAVTRDGTGVYFFIGEAF